jgi:phosphoribosylaminoimidazolecarboxamide formyltransferase / IMP cyclohydrolase
MLDAKPLTIKRAIISVSDKTGLVDFAKFLTSRGVQIYSTGGTRKHLEDAGIEAIDIATYTEFPEMMDGRVKTLHPKIFGGILAKRDQPDHVRSLQDFGMVAFDLVIVNLYPFRETVAKPNVTEPEAIEQIDIGGPSLIRAAAKNFASVVVSVAPVQYSDIRNEIESTGGVSLALRRKLATDCFAATSAYDSAIHDYMTGTTTTELLPATLKLEWQKSQLLRYGENPHQKAAVYRAGNYNGPSIVHGKQLHGKELSYNNILDLDSALSIVRCFSNPSAVVIKHNNPCGAAWAHRLSFAARKALDGDPLSAFGGIIGFNKNVDAETAEVICEAGRFIEAVVAPSYDAEAIEVLTTRPKWKESVRLIEVGAMPYGEAESHYRLISGGLLVQEADNLPASPLNWQTVTDTKVDDALWEDIAFAWEMIRHVKSNAILLAKDAAVVGVGAGQMSRVDSVHISIEKAGERAQGSVLASDAFFPFPDSIDIAAAAGVIAIIQPGGSRKDDEVTAACNKYRIPMIFTGKRHFKH